MFDFSPEGLASRAMTTILMVLSLSVHEWAHAWSALRLGDDTAAREGRLTLNPMSHIDPIGTLLLPMLGIPFGWAKPVPVNPVRFARKWSMRTGMAITASAGPISNLILAVLCAVILGLGDRFGLALTEQPALRLLLDAGAKINVALAVFNILPIPPLDGSRIAARFVPRHLEEQWDNFTRLAPFLLMLVIYAGGPLLAVPIDIVTSAVTKLFETLASG